MKYLFFLPLCLLLSFSSSAQSNDPVAVRTFTLNELLTVLNTPSDKKDLDSLLLKHGYSFENKGSVYSPSVTGPVKNAFTLRYKKGAYRFIISYYNNAAYLITYFLSSSSELNNLVAEAKKMDVVFVKTPLSETSLYGEYKDYGITVFDGTLKKFNLSNITVCDSNHLMQF